MVFVHKPEIVTQFLAVEGIVPTFGFGYFAEATDVSRLVPFEDNRENKTTSKGLKSNKIILTSNLSRDESKIRWVVFFV
jgi:hypothetical protein